MDRDFLLTNDTARHLYHDVAADLPIIDYHCHLDPQEIYGDRRFENITQLWLGGDHYKWRLMRSAGVDEALEAVGKQIEVAKEFTPGESISCFFQSFQRCVCSFP